MIVKVRISSSEAAGWLGLVAALRRGALTLGAATILAMGANSSATLPPVPRKPALDPRVARIEAFFGRYRCPAPRHTKEYLRAADGYGLDYRLLPALSIRETHCGRTEKQPHNAWGYHHQSFPSLEV